MARQAVLDVAGTLVGYELLFRPDGQDDAAGDLGWGTDGDRATSAVITSAFLEHGIERLVGPRLAFVNCTRPFLTGRLPLPFAPERVVLEVLEGTVVDDELLGGLAALRAAGYRLALDDFVLTERTAPLLAHADIVKLDVLGSTRAELAAQVAHLRGLVPQLLAEKVEDAGALRLCRELGFDLYQGYGLARPTTVLGVEPMQPSQLVCLRLIALLADDDTPAATVLDCVRADPALTLRVLHAANSAAAGRRQRVTSLGHAITCVGRKALMGWSMLTMMAADAPGRPDVATAALARARFCELLAGHAAVDPDAAFTAGFLSSLGGVFEGSLADTLRSLNLHPELVAAVLEHTGRLGAVVEAAARYDDLRTPVAATAVTATAVTATAVIATAGTGRPDAGGPSRWAPTWSPGETGLARDYLAALAWSEQALEAA